MRQRRKFSEEFKRAAARALDLDFVVAAGARQLPRALATT